MVEAADLVEVDHIVDIEERKHIAGDIHQARIVDIVVEERSIVGLVLPAGGDS